MDRMLFRTDKNHFALHTGNSLRHCTSKVLFLEAFTAFTALPPVRADAAPSALLAAIELSTVRALFPLLGSLLFGVALIGIVVTH